MKKAGKPEQSCRRQEFVCRLYDVIKDLDQSLKSDCNQGGARFVREKDNPFEPRNKKVSIDNKNKGPECFCPPGCCQDSMEFKLSSIPNYPGLEGNKNQGTKGLGGPPLHEQDWGAPSEGHPHLQTPHNHGAPSDQVQEPSQYVWHQTYHNNGCWPGHDHEASGRAGGRVQPQAQQGFRMPKSAEEAMAMGCFIAKAE